MIEYIYRNFNDFSIAIFMAIVLLLFIVLIAFVFIYRRRSRIQSHSTISAMSAVDSSIFSASVNYPEILTNMDLGVFVFSANHQLLYSNPKSKLFLPRFFETGLSLDDFMDLYGSNNGLTAGLLLGKKYLNGMVHEDDRAILVDFKQFVTPDAQTVYLITLYDLTMRENLERQRNQFVANVSHELKTPLTTIVTYTESLIDWGLNEYSKEQLSRDLQRIYDDGKRMQNLVNDLSLLSMLDNHGIRPRMEELDLNHLAKFCVDRAVIRAQDKDIVLEFHSSDRVPLAYGERASLERIITNLVENAIKYTPRHGFVKVYLNFVQDDIYIKVKDNGLGISKENLPFIFDRFYRVDNSGSSVFGGTGLGLSIAKELVELHRGQMTVSSQLGSGSEFIVILPSAARLVRECIQAHRLNQPKETALFDSLTQMILHDMSKFLPTASKISELSDEQAEQLFAHVMSPSDSLLFEDDAIESLEEVQIEKQVSLEEVVQKKSESENSTILSQDKSSVKADKTNTLTE